MLESDRAGSSPAFALSWPSVSMPRVPRRYAIHLLLSSGKEEIVHFATLEAFQQWYTSALHGGAPADSFVNVPIGELEGEYLLVRAGSVIGLRVEPLFGTLDD